LHVIAKAVTDAAEVEWEEMRYYCYAPRICEVPILRLRDLGEFSCNVSLLGASFVDETIEELASPELRTWDC
jgi:hypothetical protein